MISTRMKDAIDGLDENGIKKQISLTMESKHIQKHEIIDYCRFRLKTLDRSAVVIPEPEIQQGELF